MNIGADKYQASVSYFWRNIEVNIMINVNNLFHDGFDSVSSHAFIIINTAQIHFLFIHVYFFILCIVHVEKIINLKFSWNLGPCLQRS